MDRNIIAISGWFIVGCFLIGVGITAFFKKEAMCFWANIKVALVSDVKKYNSAVGKLLIWYGIIFILLGTPLLIE